MKIAFGKGLFDIEGKPIKMGVDDNEDATLGKACIFALAQPTKEQRPSETHNITVTKLAFKIHGTKEPLEISIDEAKILKDALNKNIELPFISGIAQMALEKESTVVEAK